MALPATYDFAGASGALPNPPWTQYQGQVNRDGSGHGGASTTNADSLAYWNQDTPGTDHYAQVDAAFTGGGAGNAYLYLIARASGSGTATGTFYWFWSDGGSDTALLSVVGGTQSTLGTANTTTFTSGDTFKLECNGTAIKVYKNGSAIISVTNSAVTSGTGAGCGCWNNGAGTVALLDNFQVDNVSGGGAAADAYVSMPPLAPARR